MPLSNEPALLCAAFLLYFATAFVWPSWRVWRRTGINPYVLPSGDDAHGFVTSGMRGVVAALFVYVLAQACWPRVDAALGVIPWLASPVWQAAGWLGFAIAMCWTIVAQFQMGRSWRIGIDRAHATGLVTNGLFAVSRNPVFLAMRLCLFSLVLIRPNALTAGLWLVGDVLMQFQVRLEEAFLRERHGAAYDSYCSRVRRWL
ncbi:methyltransferase family protein [Pseudoduganella sp. GCM10020061]|uniref:methyltransferase family protein n=1 Tax=Pseudoduganella sp. GCM10020061 TaxID=3317345 RepID=UPI00363B5E61